MGQRGLVVSRMAADRTLVLAACATALFATTVLAALVGYAGTTTREGLRRTLAQATFASAGTTLSTTVPAGGLPAARQQVDGAVKKVYRTVPVTVSMGVRSDSYTLPGQEKSPHPELTAFATYTGIDRHGRLAQGRWPAPGAGAGKDAEVEAALPAAAARLVHASVGDVLTLHGRIDEKAVVRAKIVGLFDVPEPDDYFWRGDRLVTTGVERGEYTAYGPLVVPEDVFAARFNGTGVAVGWTIMPSLGRLDAGDLDPLGDRVAHGGDVYGKALGGAQYTAVTNLPELTGRLGHAMRVTRSTLLIPVLQLILLAGCAWMLVARLLADHRRGEVALLRTRGLGMRQLTRLGVAEGALIVLPAAVCGPLLAGPLLHLAGRVPAIRDSGLHLDAGPLLPLFGVSVATALAGAVALGLPTLRGANRTFVEAQAGMGRAARGRLRGSGADLALLLVAGLAIWQLTRYGVDGATGSGGATGVDPVIVSGPALGVLAGGVLLLRAVPLASGAAERVVGRGRGLAPALGTRQVGRRPSRYAGPVLLLVMAIAVGVLSVTTMATWRRSQTDQADFQSGTDLRVAGVNGVGGATPLGTGARIAALPGVTATTGVVRTDGTIGTASAVMLAADARALEPMLRVRPGLRDALALGELAGARPGAPALVIPGRPGRLLVDVRLKRTGPTPERSPDAMVKRGPTFTAELSVADARGVVGHVALGGVPPDGRTHTIAVDAAAVTGPGGAPSYPLSVRALDYSYDANPYSGPLDLTVERIRGDGTGDAAMPAKTSWDVFAEPVDPAKPVRPRPGTGGGLLRIAIPTTPPGQLVYGAELPTSGTVVHAVLGTGTPPAHHAGNPRLLPVVPGVVSTAAATRAKVGVGGTVTLSGGEGDQPVRVVGIAEALPTVAPGTPAVLVDLPTLAQRRIAAGQSGAGGTQPTEWWASTTGGRTRAAAQAVGDHHEWGEVAADRAALRSQLRDAPLGATLQGVLVLGFGSALAFAVIAFVVNAAVTAGRRSREFAVLRALGVHPRQVAGMLAVEQAFLVVAGLAGGTVLGLVVARLVVPHLVVGLQTTEPYPPAVLIVQWPLVAAMLAGTAAVLALVLPPVIRVLRRRNVGAGLRAGEE
ncbi:FtsX-like permease family protein [Actinomadura opuntiae]|uniref:FtsX-like permease family protein n=1 Tax=Actinomadura sp. OS1-43 TaxID=604315 RepID=UPI00255B2C4E|nr:FtsX-like permease family protein [Actinomadura sp. OS1-43]MDL4815390.1 FtsX-like permease family protein [Actinomadura sp. OS1-43]